MRLIDADPLKDKEFNVYDAEHEEWYRAVKSDDIETAPTIDAVPVVRCKDCMWGGRFLLQQYVICGFFDTEMRGNDFCSHGKREEVQE